MKKRLITWLSACLLTGLAAGELVIWERKFDTPQTIPAGGYYTNAAGFAMADLRKTHKWLKFRSDTVFRITAEVECDPEATAGMKLRQIYKGEKDARVSDIFWNRAGGTIEAECRLHPDGDPEAVQRLQFIFYNCRKNTAVKLKSLKITAGNVDLSEPDLLAGKTLILEKSFEPALKLQKDLLSIIDIPFTTKEISRETVYTIELKVTGHDGIRAGLRLRHDLDTGKSQFANFFWNHVLPDNQVSRLVYSARLEEVSPSALRKLSVIAVNNNRRGDADIHSIRVFRDEKPLPQAMKIPEQTFTSLEFKPDYFPVGVYFYGSPGEIGKYAEARNLSVDEYLNAICRDIADHGCNTILFSGVSGHPEILRNMCGIAAGYNLRVFVQGNGNLYLNPSRGKEYFEDISRKAYETILPQYHGISNLEAFIPLEEIDPNPEYLAIQAKGREAVRQYLPQKSTFTLHNRLQAMSMDTMAPQPEWYGFDRYRFRLVDTNNELVISSPSDMAYLLHNEIVAAYQIAASRGRPLIYVGQGYKSEEILSKGGPRSGLREIAPGKWKGYARYMPQNGMNLQFWLSISCGARGFLLYFYQTPFPKRENDRSDGLVGLDGRESRYWREMGECLKDAKVFFPLFRTWFRERESAAAADDARVYVSSFIRPDLKGKFVVPVNTHIADWDKDSPRRPGENTALKSDAENLQGFRWAGDKTFSLQLKNPGKLYDVRNGLEVDPRNIVLPAGKGTILFQGDHSELAKIRKDLKL